MRKFKNVLALSMAAAMVLSLGACSSDSSSNETSQANKSESKDDEASQAENSADDQTEESTEGEESYDFGGVTVKVWGGFWDNVESEDLTWQEAKSYVEEKYNIVLEKAAMEGDDGSNTDEIIVQSVSGGEPCVDMAVVNPEMIITLLQNDLLYDITDYVDDLQIGSAYTQSATWQDRVYGVSYENIGDSWVIVYDRDYFEEIGMEKTPTDMFMEGKWDYENFEAYLTELKGKLPDGVYPIGMYPYHWATMASAANGVTYVDSNGQLNMMDEGFIEVMEEYQKLKELGLAYPSTRTVADDGTVTSDVPYQTSDERIVMARAEVWELSGLDFNYGVVYWPWGSNVTCEGDYTTLSDNYKLSLSYWGFNGIITPSVDKLGIPADVLLKIADDFANYNGTYSYMHEAWETEQSGDSTNYGAEAGTARTFTTEQDMELFDWAHTRSTFDWSWAISDLIDTWTPAREVLVENKDVRSTLQSSYNDLAATLEDAGIHQN